MPLYLTNWDLVRAAEKYNLPLICVFSKDHPPTRLISGGYIINLQDTTDSAGNELGGSHWVALWIDGKYACYFDPFGIPPPIQIQHILNRYVPYDINRTQIQSIESGVCGYYCLYFLWRMCRLKGSSKTRFKKFIELWNPQNPRKNRKILENLLKIT